jgi:hypothetical protein
MLFSEPVNDLNQHACSFKLVGLKFKPYIKKEELAGDIRKVISMEMP